MDEGRVYQHVRPGVAPVDPLPSYASQVVRESRQLLVVRSRSAIEDVPGLVDYFDRNGIEALIGYPIVEGGAGAGSSRRRPSRSSGSRSSRACARS
jgi:hypothetical protein